MKITHGNIEQKVSGKPIGAMLKAIGDTDTYPAHGSRLLFGEKKMTTQEARFATIERYMNKDTVLSAHRHMQKVFFQAVATMIPVLEGKAEEGGISIALRKSQAPEHFKSMRQLADFLKKDEALSFLADDACIRPTDILLLKETQDLFDKMADGSLGSKQTLNAIDELKEQFGHKTTTGF